MVEVVGHLPPVRHLLLRRGCVRRCPTSLKGVKCQVSKSVDSDACLTCHDRWRQRPARKGSRSSGRFDSGSAALSALHHRSLTAYQIHQHIRC